MQFAEAFLFGKETKGDWTMSAHFVGYVEIPEKTNIHIAKALEKIQEKADRVAAVEEIEQTKGPIDWAAAAEEVAPVMLQIAKGELKANAAQKSAIDLILIRGQGKPVEKQKKLVDAGIVVLPTPFSPKRRFHMAGRPLRSRRLSV